MANLLPPSQSLPAARRLDQASESEVNAVLHNLQAIYCPLRLPVTINAQIHAHRKLHVKPLINSDSGYASRDESNVSDSDKEASTNLQIIRADDFERQFTQRWLTTLIACIDTFALDEEAKDRIADEAAFILSSFSDSTTNDDDLTLIRNFAFDVVCKEGDGSAQVHVQLQDAPLSGSDHTDVGLQSWGASIILSELLCSSPEQFELHNLSSKDHLPKIIELGAGTGLISLTLAKLLPLIGIPHATLLATDYHAAVLKNLGSNIVNNTNQSEHKQQILPVQTAVLDWSHPTPLSPFNIPADLLVAADVVYAPEHAIWLRDCAAGLLSLTGSFWLIVTIRKEGKFHGISGTVEMAFAREDLPVREGQWRFEIVETRQIDKKKGVGRGDECGYLLYRIGWVRLELERIQD